MGTVPGYPVVIPEVVTDRLRRYFTIEPGEVLSREAEMFGGKSAIAFIADGDGNWDQVLAKYDAMFSYQVTR
jgi:hypothetical protein